MCPLFFKVRGCSVYGLAVIDEPVRAQLRSFSIPQLGPLIRWKQRFSDVSYEERDRICFGRCGICSGQRCSRICLWGRMEMTCTVSTPPKNHNGNRSAPHVYSFPPDLDGPRGTAPWACFGTLQLVAVVHGTYKARTQEMHAVSFTGG